MQKKKNVVTPVVAENTQESVMALPPELSNTNGTKKKAKRNPLFSLQETGRAGISILRPVSMSSAGLSGMWPSSEACSSRIHPDPARFPSLERFRKLQQMTTSQLQPKHTSISS